MMNWILSSSALIALVILIRALFKKRIPQRLRYGLWLLVLARLLLPFSIGSSEHSVASYTAQSRAELEYRILEAQQTEPRTWATAEAEPLAEAAAALPQTAAEAKDPEPMSIPELLNLLWLSGALLLLAVLLGSNLHFAAMLRRSRKPVKVESSLPVYVCPWLETPCLFGLIRPAIYLSPESMAEQQKLRHVLCHEASHYRQGDHIWAVLRAVCLVLHWYNPLVWLAALLSRTDGELACDEVALKRLGDGERADYGRTLLSLSQARGALLLRTATGMSGGVIKERIRMIAKKPRAAALSLILVLGLSALAVGCSFAGEEQGPLVVAEGEIQPSPVQTPAAETPRPRYEKSFTSNDGYTEFVFDMEIPDYSDTMPVLTGKPGELSMEQMQQIVTAVFGDTPVYEMEEQNGFSVYTQEERDILLQYAEKLRDDPEMIDTMQVLDSQIENIFAVLESKAEYNKAPRQEALSPMSWELKKEANAFLDIRSVTGRAQLGDVFYRIKASRSIEEGQTQTRVVIMPFDGREALFYKYYLDYTLGSKEAISQEQFHAAADWAKNYLEAFGWMEYQLQMAELGKLGGSFIRVDANVTRESYPILNHAAQIYEIKPQFRFEFAVDGTLMYLQVCTPILAQPTGETEKLLRFEECMAAMEERLKAKTPGTAQLLDEEGQSYEQPMEEKYRISKMEQVYELIHQNGEGEFYLIPTVRLFGHKESWADGRKLWEQETELFHFRAADGELLTTFSY